MKSIWLQQPIASYPALSENIRRDVVIIGGGIAGILTAFQLKKRGVNACILEADSILHGTTGHTTAKITALHGALYHKLAAKYSAEFAKSYYAAQTEAVYEYYSIVTQKQIDCNFLERPAAVYTLTAPAPLEREAEALAAVSADCRLLRSLPFPLPVRLALQIDSGQYQFHPVSFLQALAKDMEIYEHSPVTEADLTRRTLSVNGKTVRAEQLVFACHFPFPNVPGYYFARVYQSRSYTAAFQSAPNVGGMYVDLAPTGLSLRNEEDLLLVGGFDHRTGKSDSAGYTDLITAAKNIFPQAVPVACWSAQDCMTFDSVPYAGRFFGKPPGVYVITGFNKWGMTNSMACSRLVAELITDGHSKHEEVFSPKRHACRKYFGSFVRNSAESAGGLLRHYLHLPFRTANSVPKGSGAIVLYRGKKRAVYRGEDNKLYVLSAKCPHLGCELVWNQADSSWDCPCHGSRFDITGHVLNSPAKRGNRV